MLLQRLKVAIPLIAVILAVFLLPGVPGAILFSVFAILVLCLALHETLVLCGQNKVMPFLIPSCIYGIGIILVSAFYGIQAPAATVAWETILLPLFLCSVFLVSFKWKPERLVVQDILTSLAAVVYVCMTLGAIAKLYFLGSHGSIILLYLVAITKISDVGAYFVGASTAKLPGGNHKLSRLVSPNKSWEGLAGGILFSLILSLVYVHFLGVKMGGVFGYLDAVVLGVAAPVIGLIGDLGESVFKRAANMKDSGKLPGLGGILDILDSLIPMAPFFLGYYLLKVVF